MSINETLLVLVELFSPVKLEGGSVYIDTAPCMVSSLKYLTL